MAFEPDFIWIVAKQSAVGRQLASFSDDDWRRLREGVALVCEVDVEIDEDDAFGRNRTGPTFVFRIRQRRDFIINGIKIVAETIHTDTRRP